MKIRLAIVYAGFLMSNIVHATVEQNIAGVILARQATYICLARYERVGIKQGVNGERLYFFSLTSQTMLKGDKLPNDILIKMPDQWKFQQERSFTPPQTAYALFFLKKRNDGIFESAATAMQQAIAMPIFKESPPNFKSLQDLLYYLLQSDNSNNRQLGLLFSGGFADERLLKEIKRLAVHGSVPEQLFAKEALKQDQVEGGAH